MRKTLIFTLLVIFTLCLSGLAQAAPQVRLNGQNLTFDVPPTIENGRTLVPLRAIFEALGADVQWDGTTETVSATKDGTEIKLAIGGQAYKNGTPITLDVPAKLVNDRTMVPLRFVAEAFACQVGWDGTTQTVTITSSSGENIIKVHFINVGQADCIYIELPNNDDILIDAGNKDDGPLVVNYLRSQGVDDIELVIATHPHEDHIGGIPDILDSFVVEKILDSGKTATSSIYNTYAAKAAGEGCAWEADNRQNYSWGNAALQVLTANNSWEDTNDCSVVTRLDYGDIEFLFTGDAETPVEDILSSNVDAEILKVGHHGSASSSSIGFLARVNPQVAVISVGTDNSYGLPATETLIKLQARGVTIYRTDLNGNIVVTTDGATYSVETDYQSSSGLLQAAPPPSGTTPATNATGGAYVGSKKSDKYHYPDCRYVKSIAPGNQIWFKDAAEAQTAGYSPCGVCKP